MEGFCRGCLIKYDEPMELLQYTEKNRRLFVYSTGLQVKRNDTFTFQLCKDCFLNMKQACKFKKNCRTSDKRFRNYVALKDVGDPVDFCTFLKNSDDTLTFRFPMASGNSTPATQKCRDDDNESTCTSIRNFMTDILQGEEMPDTEAHIIKEVIEEEADVLDDSLDSHWLQDDMSIDTDFRLDFSFSPFSTPRTVNNDHCYTPKQKEDQVTFDTINTEKQTKILTDFTNAFKTEEVSIYGGGISGIDKTENFRDLTELCRFGIDESTRKSQIDDSLKTNQNLKDLISDLEIDEIDGMDISDSKTVESNENLKEFDISIEDANIIHETESNQKFNELCNFGKDDSDGIDNSKSNALKGNQSLKDLINNLDVDEIERIGKSQETIKSNQILNKLIGNFSNEGVDAFGNSDSNNLKSNRNVKQLCDLSFDSFSGAEKTESRIHKNVLSIKDLFDFSLDSIESIERPASNIIKSNQSLKELYDISLNSFDDATKSVSNTFKNDRDAKEMYDMGLDEIDQSETNLDLPSLPDVLEEDKAHTPDFDIPKGVIGSIQSHKDVSNSSINMETLISDKPCPIDLNLEEALKNTDNKQFSLEDLLVSPPAVSAASTPTITNILFGEKLDTPDAKAASAASTPTITNILFGEKLDSVDSKPASAASTPSMSDIIFGEKLDRPDSKPASAASTPNMSDIIFGEKRDTPDTKVVSAASTPTITNILFGEKLDSVDSKPASAASTPSMTDIIFGEKRDTPDTKVVSAASTPTIKNILFGEKLDSVDSKPASAASTPSMTDIIFGEKRDTPDTKVVSSASTPTIKNILFGEKLDRVDSKPASAVSTPSMSDIIFGEKLDTPDIKAVSAASTPTISNILFGEKLDSVDSKPASAASTPSMSDIIFGEKLDRPDSKPASAASTPNMSDILFGEKFDTPDTKAVSAASTPTITNILFGEKLDTLDSKPTSAVSTPSMTNILFGEKCDTPDIKAASAASTPTITNILFGEKLDTPDSKPASAASTPSITKILFGDKLDTSDTNTKIEQYIEQGDIEIFEEFFQNDTKEFDLEDIIRENGGFKAGNWRIPIDVEVDNKENESKNIKMEISVDDKDRDVNNYDAALTGSKNEPIMYISHTSPNDKFDIEHLYCKLCKIKYDTGRALSVHFSKFHNIKIVKPKTRNHNTNNTAVAECRNEVDINKSDAPNDKFDIETSYCKLCNIKYDTGRALSVHFSKTHRIKIVKPKCKKNRNINESKMVAMTNISDASPNDKFDIDNLFCKLCSKTYKTGRALSRHFSTTHNIKIVKPEYDRDYLLCNNCGTKCTDSSNFARHVKICQLKGKQEKFQCDRCLLEFTSQNRLEKHKTCHTKMKRKKETRKEFVCTICGAILNKQSNFVLHMRRHTKDYSEKCQLCDKGFYRQSDLKVHMRGHTGDTPFSCHFCPKLFTRRDVLSRHILIHLNERLFECDYCGLKCIKKYDLIKHIQNKICTRVKTSRKKPRTDKKEIDIDILEEQAEKVEGEKEEEKVEVQTEVTVIYVKGSDDTIKQQLPFLETERSN